MELSDEEGLTGSAWMITGIGSNKICTFGTISSLSTLKPYFLLELFTYAKKDSVLEGFIIKSPKRRQVVVEGIIEDLSMAGKE